MQFEGDVQVGGTIASVGQRLIDATAKMLIKRFFEKFSKEAGRRGLPTRRISFGRISLVG